MPPTKFTCHNMFSSQKNLKVKYLMNVLFDDLSNPDSYTKIEYIIAENNVFSIKGFSVLDALRLSVGYLLYCTKQYSLHIETNTNV